MNPAQVQRYVEMYDQDGDGYLSLKEFNVLIKKLFPYKYM